MALPPPNPLSRRDILQGAAALTASSLVPGCGASFKTTSPVSLSNPQPLPSGTVTSASVTVTATATGSIGPAFLGLSYEKATLAQPVFTASNTNLIGLFQRLSSSGILRIGGDSVDKTVWNANGMGQTSGEVAPSDVDSVAAFVKATGWTCLYGINLAGAGSGATNPTLAAQEVAYAASVFGSALYGVEIGNECDLYGDHDYFPDGWSLAQFESLWSEYRTAILAQTPGVTFTGPASAGNEFSWTVPFAAWATKDQIALITQHYYRANGQSATSTAAFLVTPDPALIADLQKMQPSAVSLDLPYRMAECNSYYHGGAPGISDSYASSLWVIDFLFDCAQNGASGVNFHGGGSSTGYTPIANSKTGEVIEARPEYYGILLFALAGQGTVYQSAVSANSLNVTAYAVKTSSGGLNVIVSNKDASNNLQVTLQLPQSVTAATLIEMTQLSTGASSPSITATDGVSIQGATVGADGAFVPAPAYTLSASGTEVTCYVPLLSAVLLQLT